MVRFRVRHLLIALWAAPAAALCLETAPVEGQLPPGRTLPDSALVVVGHPDLPADSLTRRQLRRIYLARERFWPGGLRVRPVNLPAGSDVRERFSRAALGRPSRDLGGYWTDLYFHGTQPPAVLASERAVLLFVQRTPGAVGYVRAAALDAQAPRQVKALLVLPP